MTLEPNSPRFHPNRPKDLRRVKRSHRLSYIIRALPVGLEALAGELQVPPGGRVLDYGSADGPYRRFFAPDTEFVTADLPGNAAATLELRPDGTVPAPDADFDAVLSTQVLEHVTDPAVYLRECFRVLRPGGRMLLSTHGLMIYHPDPDDYWRWTCAGLQRAVRDAGFEVRRFEGIMGLGASGLQFVQDATYGWVPRRLQPAFALVMQTLAAVMDRFETAEAKRFNALVFALVAVKP